MKRIFTFLSTVLVTGMTILSGQSGKIEFEEIRKIEIKLEGEMAHMMENMPKEQRSVKTLFFNPGATIYLKQDKGENPGETFGGMEGGVRIMMNEPDNKTFVDLENNRMIEQREFMTRVFLIEEEIQQDELKITGNQKMILDYPCMEATRTDTAGVVTRIWFAPSFPAKGGPSAYCSLPGMVLEVDINDGKQIIMAKSIDMTDPGTEIFKKPKDGKKVTRKEFDEIVAEKIKEMGGEGTGGETIIINIKH